MDLKDLLDDEELKGVLNVDKTPLKSIEEIEEKKKEVSGDYPKCGTCKRWLARDNVKGTCGNPESSRNVWIELLPMPP